MDNLTNFLKKDSSDQVDKTEIQNNYESETDITKKSEDFIKNLRVKGYIPPTKNDWLPFILNCFYYIVLVLIVGIIGANLNILSEGMHKTKNGNSGLENKLRKIFPHTQFAMDKLRIDESIDPYPQKVGKIEFPYDSWCSVCDLTVQLRLLFIYWPLKIFDASNYMMFSLFSSFITKYIKSSGVLKNFIIPILLGILIYLQLPVMVSLVAALFSSTLHPHFLQYWAGIFLSWKYIKKYVKAFLKIVTSLKNLSTASGKASDLLDETARTDKDTTKRLIIYYAEEASNVTWSKNAVVELDRDNDEKQLAADLANYLEDMEKLNTSSLSDKLDKIIYQSIKNNYKGFNVDNAYDDIRIIKQEMKEKIDDMRDKNNSNYKNLKFMVELFVFKRYHVGDGDGDGDPDPYPKEKREGLKKIEKYASDNKVDADAVADKLIDIVKHLEGEDLLFVDVIVRNKKYTINDGMWSWKDWNARTGLGTNKKVDSGEDGPYRKYTQAYKREKNKLIKNLKEQRETNQRIYDGFAWTIMIICIIAQTFKYIIDFANGIKTGDGEGLFTSNCGGDSSKLSGGASWGGGGGKSALNSITDAASVARSAAASGARSATNSNRDPGIKALSDKTALSDKIANRNVLLNNAGPRVSSVLSIMYMITDNIGRGLSGARTAIRNLINFATCTSDVMATIISLLKFIAIYLIFGWWVTPTYGLGICIAYSLSTQMKIISLLMFSSLNKKYINATIDYLKNNRYGLTIMGLLMLSYSAMIYLRPNVAVGAFISLIVCSIIIICCL